MAGPDLDLRPAAGPTAPSGAAAGTPGKRTLTEQLAGTPTGGPAAGGNATPGAGAGGPGAAPTTFSPRISVTPPDKPLLLGGRGTIAFELQNAKELPAGARLEWSALTNGVVLENLGMAATDKPRTAIKVRATAPGSDVPTALLSVFDKAGQQIAMLGEGKDVEVPRPEPTWHLERRGADGSKSTDTTRVTVGDKLHTRMTLAQVDDAIQGLGAPLGSYAPADTLTMEPGQWTAQKVFERDLTALKIGATDGRLSWRTGKMEPADALTTSIQTNVEMSEAAWRDSITGARADVDIAYRALTIYVRSMANAYATAYRNHGEVLKDQADFQKLIGDAVIGAVLAFVTGGLGGAVNKAMEALSAGKFLVEGVTDLSKFGSFPAQKASDSLQADNATAAGLTAMPQDPMAWQNEFHNRVDSEQNIVLSDIRTWEKQAAAKTPTFFRNFDPEKVVADRLVMNGKAVKSLAPVDSEAAAIEFERRMWQSWLAKNAFRLVKRVTSSYPEAGKGTPAPPGPKIDTSYEVEERTPEKIKQRCAKLGLDYGAVTGPMKQRYDREAARRNQAIADFGAYKEDPYGDDE